MDTGNAALAVGTVVLGALWTTGGRAALQRREISQELEIAARLTDERLRALLMESVHDRVAVYLFRRREAPELSGRAAISRMLTLIVAWLVMMTASELNDRASGTWSVVLTVILFSATGIIGLVAGSMLAAMYRDVRHFLLKWRSARARVALGNDNEATAGLPRDPVTLDEQHRSADNGDLSRRGTA